MRKITIVIIGVLLLLSSFIIFNYANSNHIKQLKFASWGSQSEVQVLNTAIKNFRKNTNIDVDFIHIPQNYFQKIHLLFASNLEPDVIFINNQNIQMYLKAGLLEDLTLYFPDSYKIFYSEAVNCFKDNNKLYAIPRDISNIVIYYNKDLFKHNNIQPPAKLNDINELKDLAEKLTSKNIFGINYEEDSLYWFPFLCSNGGGILSDNKKTVIINSKESIDALNMYSDFINKYHIAPSKAEIGSMTTAQMFITGKLAMYIGGRWMVPKFRETISFDWDVIEFPTNNHKLYSDASGWAISKKSKNKEAAVKLIQYLSSKEVSDDFTKYGLIIPARKDSIPILISQDKLYKPRNSQAYINTILNSKPTPVNENYNIINDIIKEKAQIVFNENKKAEDIFDKKTLKKLESLI